MVRLNHIGIAARNVPALEKLFSLLGMGIGSVEDVPDQGVRTHFLPLEPDQGGSHLELLEVLDSEDQGGAVAQFLSRRGPGIHHLSFTVGGDRLDDLCGRLRAEGVRLIYDQPRNGAHSMRINFIHPSSAGGVLIELMEPRKS